MDTENRLVAASGGGRAVDEMGQKIQPSIYKISHGDGIDSLIAIVNNSVLHI